LVAQKFGNARADRSLRNRDLGILHHLVDHGSGFSDEELLPQGDGKVPLLLAGGCAGGAFGHGLGVDELSELVDIEAQNEITHACQIWLCSEDRLDDGNVVAGPFGQCVDEFYSFE